MSDSKHLDILTKAREIIYGDREKTYGAPDKNLAIIAEFWRTYIKARFNIQPLLTPDDVCVMMILLKQARLANDLTHKDSQIDTAGYIALLERIQAHRSKQVENTFETCYAMTPEEYFKSRTKKQEVKTERNVDCNFPNCHCSKPATCTK